MASGGCHADGRGRSGSDVWELGCRCTGSSPGQVTLSVAAFVTAAFVKAAVPAMHYLL